MLEEGIKPLNDDSFTRWNWCFQQDSAMAHIAKLIQQWLTKHVPHVISTNKWTSASPDLSPLDYRLWNKLEEVAYPHRRVTLSGLKASIMKPA